MGGGRTQVCQVTDGGIDVQNVLFREKGNVFFLFSPRVGPGVVETQGPQMGWDEVE